MNEGHKVAIIYVGSVGLLFIGSAVAYYVWGSPSVRLFQYVVCCALLAAAVVAVILSATRDRRARR